MPTPTTETTLDRIIDGIRYRSARRVDLGRLPHSEGYYNEIALWVCRHVCVWEIERPGARHSEFLVIDPRPSSLTRGAYGRDQLQRLADLAERPEDKATILEMAREHAPAEDGGEAN